MADPTRPAQGAYITPEWGQWVHDRQVDGALQLLANLTTASWTVPTAGVAQTIPLSEVVVNVGNGWQAGTYTWKAPKAGWIEVSASACIVPNPNVPGNVFLAIFNNSKEHRFAQLHMATGNVATFQGSGTRLIQVAVNDLIKFTVNANYPGAAAIVNGDFAFMSIRYLSTT